MAVFRNNTNQIIRAMINGSRRPINPGQTIHGPETLASIPGLEMIKQNRRTQLPKKPQNSRDKSKRPVRRQPPTVINPTKKNSVFSKQISEEMQYHKKMLGLGKAPSVSIAILTKDAYNLIRECCESILNKVKYKNTTIVICDTGTTDKRVLNYYKELQAKCQEKGFNFQIVNMNYYQFSKNYNEVARHIRTDYFLIQNNDTKAINDYVSEMMGLAVMNKVGSVGPRMKYPDGRIQHDGQHIFQPTGEHRPGTCGHLNIGARDTQLPQREHRTKFVDGNTAAGCLLRTEDFRKIQGFDDKYLDIFQDVDLMIKIPALTGRFNYCNRNAEIIHHDNASRFANGNNPTRWNAMRQDTMYLKRKCDTNGWRRVNPKQVDFTIVTLAYNYENYCQMLKSLEHQDGDHTIEIIGIPNYHGVYDSIFKAYNNATDVASGKYIIYCHDDIEVTSNFLNRIKANINEFDAKGVKWGVLGPAGIMINTHRSAFYLLDEQGKKFKDTKKMINADDPNIEVESLDELCLITQKSNDLRFSEKEMTGFHFYGIDICKQGVLKGLRTFAIDAYCHHKSDGSKNIYDRDKFSGFVRHLKAWHAYAKKNKIFHWRTTTAVCNGKVIIVFATPDYIQRELKGQPLIISA